MNIANILEAPEILPYIESRQLLKQYQKAKLYILMGHLNQVNFKLRQPKENDIYSFRINKQFRALCLYKKGELTVFKIDNHQH